MLATVTVQAYPAGTELWYVDHRTVRRVRVRSFQYTSHARDGAGWVRHYLEPADHLSAGKGAKGVMPLDIDVARVGELHATRGAAEAYRAATDARCREDADGAEEAAKAG